MWKCRVLGDHQVSPGCAPVSMTSDDAPHDPPRFYLFAKLFQRNLTMEPWGSSYLSPNTNLLQSTHSPFLVILLYQGTIHHPLPLRAHHLYAEPVITHNQITTPIQRVQKAIMAPWGKHLRLWIYTWPIVLFTLNQHQAEGRKDAGGQRYFQSLWPPSP